MLSVCEWFAARDLRARTCRPWGDADPLQVGREDVVFTAFAWAVCPKAEGLDATVDWVA